MHQLIYDGNCNFCTTQILKHKTELETINIELIGDTKGNFNELKLMLNPKSYEINTESKILGGTDAILWICQHLNKYKWIYSISKLPFMHTIFSLIYKFITNNRYKIK